MTGAPEPRDADRGLPPVAIEGACHCGNIRWTLHTRSDPDSIIARACDCSFCRQHGARTWSDPRGRAELRLRDPEMLQLYRFGTGITDFLICRVCGAYAGAVVREGEAAWTTLNLRLAGREWPERPVHYGPEDRATRRARRQELWTPLVNPPGGDDEG